MSQRHRASLYTSISCAYWSWRCPRPVVLVAAWLLAFSQLAGSSQIATSQHRSLLQKDACAVAVVERLSANWSLGSQRNLDLVCGDATSFPGAVELALSTDPRCQPQQQSPDPGVPSKPAEALLHLNWVQCPSWSNGIIATWIQNAGSGPWAGQLLSSFALAVQHLPPPPSAIGGNVERVRQILRDASDGSGEASDGEQEYDVFSFDASTTRLGLLAASTQDFGHLPETSCVLSSRPQGPLHPRTFLLLWYRRDVLRGQLAAAAGQTGSTGAASGSGQWAEAPADWESLIALLEAHRLALQDQQQDQQQGGDPAGQAQEAGALPRYGLCLTTSPHCGRLGDVWAAIAASVVQTRGSAQGYVYDMEAPPPSVVPLVNGTGWRHAAGILQRLLSYNAPSSSSLSYNISAAAAQGPQDDCHAVSPLFTAGDCLVTMEWDAALQYMASSPALARPGVLGVSPLPGSRKVVAAASSAGGGSTQAPAAAAGAADNGGGELAACSRDTCAHSVNHDFLYGMYGLYDDVDSAVGGGGGAAAAPPPLLVTAPWAAGYDPSRSPQDAVARVQAAAVAKLLQRDPQQVWQAASSSVAAAEGNGTGQPLALRSTGAAAASVFKAVAAGGRLVNRAPYSAFYDTTVEVNYGSIVAAGGDIGLLSTAWEAADVNLLEQRLVRQAASAALRAGLGAGTAGRRRSGANATICDTYIRTAWWKLVPALASSNNDTSNGDNSTGTSNDSEAAVAAAVAVLTQRSLPPDLARQYLYVIWHAVHHPNMAPDIPAPSSPNWFRWALGHAAALLLPEAAAVPASSPAGTDDRAARRQRVLLQAGNITESDGATAAVAATRVYAAAGLLVSYFDLAAEVLGPSSVRSTYEAAIGAPAWRDVHPEVRHGSNDDDPISGGALVGLIIGCQIAVLLLAALLAYCAWRRYGCCCGNGSGNGSGGGALGSKGSFGVAAGGSSGGGGGGGGGGYRRARDLLGRVRAPRVGPDTTLLITDVQNSTGLWEALSVATMDAALQIHHSTIRRVLAEHDGYESATEGDPFIVAFACPAAAVSFATSCQLALLEQDWPQELLEHPDGATVIVDPRDGMAAASALGVHLYGTGGAGAGGIGGAGGPDRALSGRPAAAAASGSHLFLPSFLRGPSVGWWRVSGSLTSLAATAAAAQGRTLSGPPIELLPPPSPTAAAAAAAYNGRTFSGPPDHGGGGGFRTSPRPSDDGTGNMMPYAAAAAAAAAASPGPLRVRSQMSDGQGASISSTSRPFVSRYGTAAAAGGGAGGDCRSLLTSLPALASKASLSLMAMAGSTSSATLPLTSRMAMVLWREALAAVFPVSPLPPDEVAADPGALVLSGRGRPVVRLQDGRIVAFRGLRVRMGLHSGLDNPRNVVFNKVASSYQYTGDFAEATRLVSETAAGGLVVMSGAAFTRLRNTVEHTRSRSRSAGAKKAAKDFAVVYAGHHVIKGAAAVAPAAAAAAPDAARPPAVSPLAAAAAAAAPAAAASPSRPGVHAEDGAACFPSVTFPAPSGPSASQPSISGLSTKLLSSQPAGRGFPSGGSPTAAASASSPFATGAAFAAAAAVARGGGSGTAAAACVATGDLATEAATRDSGGRRSARISPGRVVSLDHGIGALDPDLDQQLCRISNPDLDPDAVRRACRAHPELCLHRVSAAAGSGDGGRRSLGERPVGSRPEGGAREEEPSGMLAGDRPLGEGTGQDGAGSMSNTSSRRSSGDRGSSSSSTGGEESSSGGGSSSSTVGAGSSSGVGRDGGGGGIASANRLADSAAANAAVVLSLNDSERKHDHDESNGRGGGEGGGGGAGPAPGLLREPPSFSPCQPTAGPRLAGVAAAAAANASDGASDASSETSPTGAYPDIADPGPGSSVLHDGYHPSRNGPSLPLPPSLLPPPPPSLLQPMPSPPTLPGSGAGDAAADGDASDPRPSSGPLPAPLPSLGALPPLLPRAQTSRRRFMISTTIHAPLPAPSACSTPQLLLPPSPGSGPGATPHAADVITLLLLLPPPQQQLMPLVSPQAELTELDVLREAGQDSISAAAAGAPAAPYSPTSASQLPGNAHSTPLLQLNRSRAATLRHWRSASVRPQSEGAQGANAAAGGTAAADPLAIAPAAATGAGAGGVEDAQPPMATAAEDEENGRELHAAQPLYLAVPAGLLCRLALCGPLRTCWVAQVSSLDAPTGSVTVVFLKVVGAATLLAELPGPAAAALDQCQRLVCGLLGGAGGYLVEGCGDGLVLAAFGSPAAAVEWALDCVEGLKRLDWDTELLAHELCAEQLDVGVAASGASFRRNANLGGSAARAQLQGLSAKAGGRGGGESGPDACAVSFSVTPPPSAKSRSRAPDSRSLAFVLHSQLHQHELQQQRQQQQQQQQQQRQAVAFSGADGSSSDVQSFQTRTAQGGGGKLAGAVAAAAAVEAAEAHLGRAAAALTGAGREPQQQQQQQPGAAASSRRVGSASGSAACLNRGLRIKVGLATGVASHSLNATSGRLSYRGKLMNRASRIAGVAAAGQVLCSSAVWEACEAEDTDFTSRVAGLCLGPVELKGMRAPLQLVQCVRETDGEAGAGM